MLISKFKKYGHIIISILLAVTAGMLVYYFVNINTPTQNVVVANGRLAVGATITPNMVKMDLYPKSKIPVDAIFRTEDVVGKTVIVGVLNEGIIRNENITTDKGSLAIRLATLAPGRIAVDLPSDTAPGLEGVVIGDKINIYTEVVTVTSSGGTISRIQRVATEAVVINTPILARGDMFTGPTGSGAYIVAVNPEETEYIADGIVRAKNFSVFLLPPGASEIEPADNIEQEEDYAEDI